MGGEADREVRPAPAAGPPPPPLQPYTARADAAEAALDQWGRAQAQRFGITWGAAPGGPARLER